VIVFGLSRIGDDRRRPCSALIAAVRAGAAEQIKCNYISRVERLRALCSDGYRGGDSAWTRLTRDSRVITSRRVAHHSALKRRLSLQSRSRTQRAKSPRLGPPPPPPREDAAHLRGQAGMCQQNAELLLALKARDARGKPPP